MTRPASRVEKVRLSLEVSIAVRDCMEDLQDRTGAESLTEVVRRALAVYSTVLDASEAGRLVWKNRDGSEHRVILPKEIV